MNLSALMKCPLFNGISEHEIQSLLSCLSAKNKTYKKEDFIFTTGEKVVFVGIVTSGSVHVIQEDFWGNRLILSRIGEGGMFGEAFSCSETDILPVSVVAAEKSEIVLINYRKIITNCASVCGFHTKMITNMLRVLAEKNLLLTKKMVHLSKKTTRGKILSFLSVQAARKGSKAVEIPFSRQELADYLCVDRSALSRELSQMQAEGVIKYDKNRFELLRQIEN